MKKLLLLSAGALRSLSALAQAEAPTLTEVFKYTAAETTFPASRFATMYNGTIYAQDGGTLYSWSKDSKDRQTVLADASFAGYAITTDDAGNIIYSTNKWGGGATAWAFMDKNKKVTTFTITLPEGLEAASNQTCSHVVGDITSADGGYMYNACNKGKSVMLVHMANMGSDKATVTATASTAFNIIVDDAAVNLNYECVPSAMLKTVAGIKDAEKPADMVYLRKRGDYVTYYLDGTETEKYDAPSNSYSSTGYDVFELGGVKFALYPQKSAANTYSTTFVIADLLTGDVVATQSSETTMGSGAVSYQTLKAEKVSETKANIYQYYCNTVASMYTFEIPADYATAIESVAVDANAPVEYYNLQGVKVANPENGLFIKKQGNKATKVIL